MPVNQSRVRAQNNGFTQSVTVSTDAFGNTRTTINTSRAPSPPMFAQAQPQWTQVGREFGGFQNAGMPQMDGFFSEMSNLFE